VRWVAELVVEATGGMVSAPMVRCVAPSTVGVALLLLIARAAHHPVPAAVGPVVEAARGMVSVPMEIVAPSTVGVALLLLIARVAHQHHLVPAAAAVGPVAEAARGMVSVPMEIVAPSTVGVALLLLIAPVPLQLHLRLLRPHQGKPRCTADLAVARTTMMSPAEHATGKPRTLKTKDIPRVRRTTRHFGKRSKSMVRITLWPLITRSCQLQKAVNACVESKSRSTRMGWKFPVVRSLSLMVVRHAGAVA
jgi:hypothetical protein